jgi:hypothetical protein
MKQYPASHIMTGAVRINQALIHQCVFTAICSGKVEVMGRKITFRTAGAAPASTVVAFPHFVIRRPNARGRKPSTARIYTLVLYRDLETSEAPSMCLAILTHLYRCIKIDTEFTTLTAKLNHELMILCTSLSVIANNIRIYS